MNQLTYLSLGAGVQSSTLALMAAAGEVTPMPSAGVFADTQSEPAAVYTWLDWLEKQLPFPVVRVTCGNLGVDACRVRISKSGNAYTRHAVPAYIRDTDGRLGFTMRQCTTSHKIEVIYREYNRRRSGEPVEQWVGISRDEAGRMKPARLPWVTNRWPLIELGMTRQHCLAWMQSHGYPRPPRSACVFCPFHNDQEWARMRAEDAEAFVAAVTFERNYQAALAQVPGLRGTPYLHHSCVPLDRVDLRPDDEKTGQLNLFGNECEGMCGV